jgi:hypothetical protein
MCALLCHLNIIESFKANAGLTIIAISCIGFFTLSNSVFEKSAGFQFVDGVSIIILFILIFYFAWKAGKKFYGLT